MRKLMAVRFQDKMYRFSVFGFDALLAKLGGYLPTNFFAYHFDEDSPRYARYQELEPIRHRDGLGLGAFPHNFVLDPVLRDDAGVTYRLINHRWQREGV